MSSFEETLGTLLDAKLAPLRADVRTLSLAIECMRRNLPPVLLPVREAAQMLGLSESTIRRHISQDVLPSRRIGHSVRVDMSALRPLTAEEVEREAHRARIQVPRSRGSR